MIRIIVVALATLFIANLALIAGATELRLDFRQFPAPAYNGKMAAIQLDDDMFPAEFLFRYAAVEGESVEMLADRVYREKAKNKDYRFAGHYVVLTTGCGVALQCGVIVDLKTGRMEAKLPTATTEYEFRPQSRLLVVNGWVPKDPADYSQYPEQTTYYYQWDGKEFSLLAQEAWPTSVSPELASEMVAEIVRGLVTVPLPTPRPDLAITDIHN